MTNPFGYLFKYILQGLITSLAGYFVLLDRVSFRDLTILGGVAMAIYMIFDMNCAVSNSLK